eukprot:2736146-Lingulodinium_polyedra.AAC.1
MVRFSDVGKFPKETAQERGPRGPSKWVPQDGEGNAEPLCAFYQSLRMSPRKGFPGEAKRVSAC